MKTKIIPFDAKMAKDIQDGKIKGRIRTKEGDFTARIICFDKVKLVHGDGATEKQIVSLTYNENAREDVMYVHNQKGEVQAPFGWQRGYDLVLEVPDEVPDNEPQFKPFDKVLVRNEEDEKWETSYFSHIDSCRDILYYVAGNIRWKQCIPYESHENLVGTIGKPKED